MKQLLFTVALIFSISSIQAQKVGFWFDTGAKLAYGPTGLLNNNIFDDSKYDHALTSGYGVGAKLGIFYGRYNGINIDAMYNTGRQKFEYRLGDEANNIHTIDWNTIDMSILYRLQKASVYIELGPQFSFVNKVTQQIDGQPDDVTDFYNDQFTSAVFGFGGYVLNSGTFTLMFGMRLAYGLTDIISSDGQTANYPNPLSENAPYSTYEKTTTAQAMFMIEANYGIGYFAKTSCSHRMTFFRYN